VADDTDPPEGDLGDRVDRLETGQSSIIAKLDQLISGGTGKKADPPEGQPGGRPLTVAEQVQAELARGADDATAKAEKDAEKTERQTIKERLAKLTEAPPVRPVPRRERAMWGKQ